MIAHKAVQLLLRAVAAACPSLPAVRSWENVNFTPPVGVVYVEEDFVPAGGGMIGALQGGLESDTGLYVLKWFGLANTGLSISDGADTLLACFPPGRSIGSAGGLAVRVRPNPKPWRGQVKNLEAGRAVCVITIPWVVYSNTL